MNQARNWLGLGWLLVSTIRVMAADDSAIDFFERRIRPVLADSCYECHNSVDKKKGKLALDHRAALLAGGESGPGVANSSPFGGKR